MSKQSRAKKIHSFFDSKKKIKIHNENTSKRTESNKTKVFKKKKKKETNENISTSKENKDRLISNKGNKDNMHLMLKQRGRKETHFSIRCGSE